MTRAQEVALEELWPTYGVDQVDGLLDLELVFGNANPVTTEIGFGVGEHLIARASREMQRNFLGIDVHEPGAGRLLREIHDLRLSNVKVMCADASEVLKNHLAPAAVAEVIIYFPDPWPKKRHHKRRLIQMPFVQSLARAMAAGASLRLATDWADYAAQMLDVLNDCPEFRNLAGKDYVERPDDRPETRFERRGLRLGHQVFDLHFERVAW